MTLYINSIATAKVQLMRPQNSDRDEGASGGTSCLQYLIIDLQHFCVADQFTTLLYPYDISDSHRVWIMLGCYKPNFGHGCFTRKNLFFIYIFMMATGEVIGQH